MSDDATAFAAFVTFPAAGGVRPVRRTYSVSGESMNQPYPPPRPPHAEGPGGRAPGDAAGQRPGPSPYPPAQAPYPPARAPYPRAQAPQAQAQAQAPYPQPQSPQAPYPQPQSPQAQSPYPPPRSPNPPPRGTPPPRQEAPAAPPQTPAAPQTPGGPPAPGIAPPPLLPPTAPRAHPWWGLATGLGCALVGAVAYGVLIGLTKHEIGYAAIVLGIAVGFPAGRLGGRGLPVASGAAVLSVLSAFLGQLIGEGMVAAKTFDMGFFDLFFHHYGEVQDAWNADADPLTWIFLVLTAVAAVSACARAAATRR